MRADKLMGRLEPMQAVLRWPAVRRAKMPAAICLLLGMAPVLLATGCATSGADLASDASARTTTSSTPAGQPLLYRVPSGSMEPTLPIGTTVVVKKKPPTLGAIVVFHPPSGAVEQRCGPTHYEVTTGGAPCDQTNPQESSELFIKRIVAGPGDEILIRAGHVYRKPRGAAKFVQERDPYIRACRGVAECNFPIPIKISAGHWFLLGDNRGESDDSRFWGPVPTAWIVGVAAGYIPRSRHTAHSGGLNG